MVTVFAFASASFALLLLSTASPAAAQDTFGDLPARVKLGQKIVVHDEHGNKTRGTVTSASASELVIMEAKTGASGARETRTFRPDQVRRVQKHGPIWDGAIKGAAIGLIPIAALAIGAGCDDDCGAAAEVTAFAVGLGAGIGLAIDAAVPPRTLFRRGGTTSKVALAPIVGRERRGIALSLRF